MFQYAAGRALAARHNVQLKLDICMFDEYSIHNGFELSSIFNIDASVAKDQEIKRMIGWRTTRIGRRLLGKMRFPLLEGKNYSAEKQISFNEQFFSLPKHCYLVGYWQSERYFKDYESLIRKNFTFNRPMKSKNIELSERIRDLPGAVSIHIRRGDYVTNAKTKAVHGTCSKEYYKRAIRRIKELVDDPVYFIFSDDPEWVRCNFYIDGEHCMVNHNCGNQGYNDMRLMSLCKHHIIANSSFSWWGAWLNPYKDKIVIAPKRWFANGANCSTHVPSKWLRI